MKRKHSDTWMWLMAGLVAAAASAASCGDDADPSGPPKDTTTTTSAPGGSGGSGASGASGGGGSTVGGGGSGGAGGEAGPLGSYPGQPPVMAHDPYGCNMNCLDCHESGNAGAPITPHPERLMCRQCHLPQENVGLWVDNVF
jgi:nitrate reductase cytochrome c-type subunit